jgi:hypothetical protein
LVLGKKLLSSILALLVFTWTGSALMEMSAEASPVPACPIIEVSDVVPGMRGIGKTVFRGTQPEDFDVEVIAVLDGAGKPNDLILIRVSGPAIEDAGGIAEGMSGSPVYVDGKLLGAIAYVFSGSDHFMGMVTPISDMLRILSYPDTAGAPRASEGGLGNQAWLGKVPTAAATPMSVSGLSGRSLERLSRSLEKYGLTVRHRLSTGAKGNWGLFGSSSEESSQTLGADIVPGSAIGVQLARGDIEVTAFGTVTYVDGDVFLAFGHPVLGKGSSALAACSASVYGIIKSDSAPFKVLGSGTPVGVVTQDRLSGVGGKLGQADTYVPVSIGVVDCETNRNKMVSVSIAPEESLIAEIFGVAALEAMDGATDRVGPGTATVSLKMKVAGRDRIERQNIFFSSSDVSGTSIGEAYDMLWLIANNAAEKADIEDIELHAEIEPVRRTARIESVKVMEKSVRPGDTVTVLVTLRQHRGDRVTKTMSIVVPEDAPGGILSMCVRGGNVSIFDEGDYGSDPASLEEMLYIELDDMIANLTSRPCGNELVLELEPYLFDDDESGWAEPENPEAQLGGLRDRSSKEKESKAPVAGGAGVEPSDRPTMVRMETDWVIEGMRWVTVDVETPDQEIEGFHQAEV